MVDGILKKHWPLLLALLGVFGLSLIYSTPTHAAPVVGFNPGLIIDDGIFTNSDSMSPNDIQLFLNSKVVTCKTNGVQPHNYPQTTFTCLKDYRENGKLASQIIYDVAKEFTINPQVLLTLLQKEQSLVTDTWPSDSQYRIATGYGCPDSTPGVCDSKYYGFTNQVSWAARMFRSIMNNSSGWYTPYVLGNNTIYYNPGPYDNANSRYFGRFGTRADIQYCGSTVVNIQNRATQALYNYTPYQPNQAALNAGWAAAPPCGAYGNRNFYQYFTDWFGSTTTRYTWSTVSQNAYYDDSKTLPVNMGTLAAGERYYLTVSIKNTGNVTWNKLGQNPVNLGTTDAKDRVSTFCDPTWINKSPGCNRIASLKEYTVAPGQIGSFEFWITAPSTGSYNELFAPVMEGVTWMGNGSISFPAIVSPSYYTSAITGQYAYTNSTKQTYADIRSLTPGTKYYLGIDLKNTGNVTWNKLGPNPVNLGTTDAKDRVSPFCDSTWINSNPGCNRISSLKEYTVAPGQIGSFEFWVTAPSTGSYNENYLPVVEGKNWMQSPSATFSIGVAPYTWSVGKQSVYIDSSKTTLADINNLKPNTRYYTATEIKNTGNVTWNKLGQNPTSLGTSNARDRTSLICDTTWLACNRPNLIHEYSIGPGQTGSYEFWIKTPASTGALSESFTPLVEGQNWMGSSSITLNLKVQ